MTRPEGMTRPTWRGVRQLLEAIVACYPKAYPSQFTLAGRLEVDVRTVQRWTAAAVRANLLAVTPDAGAEPRRQMGSKTNRYHVILSSYHDDRMPSQENTNTYGVGSSSSRRTSSSVPRSAAPAGRQDPSGPQRSTVVAMKEWQEQERDVGAPAAPSLRSKRPAWREGDPDAIVSEIDSRRRKAKRLPKPPPDFVRLGDYFNVLWQQMQMETGRYKDTRGLENYRMVRTYIRKHFDGKTELEVRKLMEEFVTAVGKMDIKVKENQSGWMCFTGAWGRARHVITSDPYAAYPNEG